LSAQSLQNAAETPAPSPTDGTTTARPPKFSCVTITSQAGIVVSIGHRRQPFEVLARSDLP
jgi:hypothetical protein